LRLSSLDWSRATLFLAAAALAVLATPALRAQSSSSQAKTSRAQTPQARPPQAQSGAQISVGTSPQLFAALCSLYAAGLPPESTALSSDPAFAELFAQLQQLQGPATKALRDYYRDHVLGDAAGTVSQYVAFALVAGPPPKFAITMPREELPPDVLTLDGFSEILANFYQEAQIEQRWGDFQPIYERLAEPLNQPLGRVVFTETSYLRELLQPSPRTFTVYAEPLVGTRTNFRNIGDRYVVVANPTLDSNAEIGHAFLHFLLDQLPLRYDQQLVVQSQLLQVAGRAPRLPPEFRNDWAAFFAECLVRAVELKLRHLTPQQMTEEINAADGDGYVLVRPLITALASFEASEPSMTLYFPDLARLIDTDKEQARLKTFVFAAKSDSGVDAAGSSAAASAAPGELDPAVEAALNEGERLIAGHDAPSAEAAFESVLAKVPGQPRALYGLAVASVLQGNGARAEELFEQVVAAAPSDTNVLAWSHVYLGRMQDLAGSREEAVNEYKAALAITGAPEAARSAAQRGIDQAYQPAGHAPTPQ
jgi:hypothetical protein